MYGVGLPFFFGRSAVTVVFGGSRLFRVCDGASAHGVVPIRNLTLER